jgi:hypothetical protein
VDFDSNGLSLDTTEEITLRILARLQSTFGGTLNTQLTSLSGQFARIVGEELAVYQQTTSLLNRSFDPNAATGVPLDQRAALTGSVRKGATYSEVEGTLTASGPCVVADGTIFSNVEFAGLWETINGPYTFLGAGTQDATLQAVESGPVNAQAGNTWTAVTVIANLTGFTNPSDDATLGTESELDPAFRRRRTVELFARGNGPLATVTAVVGRVDGVVSCRTYHNPSENPVGTDPNTNLGIPFKAGNVVVETSPSAPGSALQQAIFDAMFSAGGLGVEFYGTDYSGTVVDSEGQSHPVAFDVVAAVNVYLRITITTAASGGGDGPVVPLDPDQMAELVADSCVEAAADLYTTVGRDFRALDYTGTIWQLINAGELSGIDGLVVEVSDDNATWVTTFVAITLREKIDLDSVNVQVWIDGTQYLP